MGSDRERWDARYRSVAAHVLTAPDPFVERALDSLGAGRGRRALDLAGGRGRHARALLERGFAVELVDISPIGLAHARASCAEGALLLTRELDLAGPSGAERAVRSLAPAELVLVVDFLERALWDRLAELVAPGGHVVVATFTTDRAGQHPSARYCLAPGELAPGLPGLAVQRYEERDGRAGLVARSLHAGWSKSLPE